MYVLCVTSKRCTNPDHFTQSSDHATQGVRKGLNTCDGRISASSSSVSVRLGLKKKMVMKMMMFPIP